MDSEEAAKLGRVYKMIGWVRIVWRGGKYVHPGDKLPVRAWPDVEGWISEFEI